MTNIKIKRLYRKFLENDTNPGFIVDEEGEILFLHETTRVGSNLGFLEQFPREKFPSPPKAARPFIRSKIIKIIQSQASDYLSRIILP